MLDDIVLAVLYSDLKLFEEASYRQDCITVVWMHIIK